MTFDRWFLARLEVLAALHVIGSDAREGGARLHKARLALAEAGETIVMDTASATIAPYLALVEVQAQLADWRVAVRTAEQDADRHRRAALLLLDELPDTDRARWKDAIAQLRSAGLSSVGEVSRTISLIPLPIPMQFKEQATARPVIRSSESDLSDEPERVAIVKFIVGGSVVDPDRPFLIAPGLYHEIVANVVVPRWPPGADRLVLEPTAVDRRDLQILDCPTFHVVRVPESNLHDAKDWGRIKVERAHAFSARPFSIGYNGRFEPGGGDVALLGAYFSVNSHDLEREPLTGFAEGDRAVLSVREHLRAISPPVADSQIESVLMVVRRLASVAGAAQQGNFFSQSVSEAEFQKQLLLVLRSDAQLGSDIMEAAKSAGGITDISFRNIPIELKVEAAKVIALDDAADYFDQTRQYVAGNARRIGVVCVLECTPKKTPPPGLASDIGVRLLPTADGSRELALAVVVIRGNLPRPSDHSR